MKYNLVWLACAFVLIVLGGCKSSGQVSIPQFDENLAQLNFDFVKYKNWKRDQHYDAIIQGLNFNKNAQCGLYFHKKQYDKAEICLDSYENNQLPEFHQQRRKKMLSDNAYNQYHAESQFYLITSLMAFDLKKYKKAYNTTSKAMMGININQKTQEVTYIPTHLGKPWVDFTDLTTVLRVRALASLQLGNRDEAIKIAERIPKLFRRNIYGSKHFESSAEKRHKEITSAIIYVALAEYDKAEAITIKYSIRKDEKTSRTIGAMLTLGLSEVLEENQWVREPTADHLYIQSELCVKKGGINCEY